MYFLEISDKINKDSRVLKKSLKIVDFRCVGKEAKATIKRDNDNDNDFVCFCLCVHRMINYVLVAHYIDMCE